MNRPRTACTPVRQCLAGKTDLDAALSYNEATPAAAGPSFGYITPTLPLLLVDTDDATVSILFPYSKYHNSLFILERVVQTDFLPSRVLCRCSPDHCVSELFDDFLVNSITEILDGTFASAQHYRRRVVGLLTSWLGVSIISRRHNRVRSGRKAGIFRHSHSHKVQFGPHELHELVNVEPVLRRHGNAVRKLIKEDQFLYADGVDLVEHADHWNVDSVALNDVDDILDSGVGLVDRDRGRVHSVLGQDGSDLGRVDLGEWDCVGDSDLSSVKAMGEGERDE
jgi:hypothetical protein